MQVRIRTRREPRPGADVEVFDTILQAPAGGRAIESDEPDCEALREQLQLVVGILVEAGRGAPVEPLPEPEEEEQEEEQEAEPPREPAEPPRAPKRRRSFRVGPKRTHMLGLLATGGWGLLPGGYPGADLYWAASKQGGIPVRLGGAFEGPGKLSVDPGRATFFSGRMTISVCPEWPVGRVRVGGCGIVGLGATRVRSYGFAENEELRRPSFTVGGEGFVAVPLAGRVEVVVGLQALGIPYRPKFVYNAPNGNRPLVFQPKPLAVRGHGGLQLRFR